MSQTAAEGTTDQVTSPQANPAGENSTPNTNIETNPSGPLSLADLYDQSFEELSSDVSDETDYQSQETQFDGSESGHEGTDGADTETATDEWDWSTLASKPVTVKVDGKDIEVPFEELRNGYMRQADYTRKTQEVAERQRLAEWAEDFQNRWNQDPAGMIRLLSAAAGPSANQNSEPQPDPLQGLIQEYPELAPFADQMRQQQELIAQMHQQLEQVNQGVGMTQQEIAKAQSLEMVKQEIAQVKSEFSDFDEMQALPIAAQMNVDLRTAYFILKGQGQLGGGAGEPSAPAAATAPPAPKPAAKPAVDQDKKRQTNMVTNSRASAETTMDGVEYDSFSELFDIVSKTEGR